MPQMFPSYVLLLSALVWSLFLIMLMVSFWLNMTSLSSSGYKEPELKLYNLFNQTW